ncbi:MULTISPECIES: type II toxin-antitoxin system VapB family antitoxin [Mycolicibacterium]|jgi:antitoxin VapB|uniref:type II toxin-antitoxin system VapB family antitoxin n=1 Tax=Mycolicibacterium TaxID=1866885 RepID=UPI0005643612|nr:MULTISPECIES: type II toxin-antitoxin system VapB family antitoxin [Mycolicibacterium]QZT57948.1 type II toxin-antitoxin system VapB family antitoxin [Mycolicibacterium austroafricanum]QZT63219.1 type II toxin-antitoxin system VapB family antitoxin [Mycolicibacterium austroafricanum]QZY47279.1 type II toxin-antitoxin system VapB family antitoxin [Mycolicibacterium austroafricanum]
MALNIKDEKVHDAVKQLARLTGESQAQAVATAVQERLSRVQQDDLAERLLALGRRTAQRMTSATNDLDHGEMLYDDAGLPR